GPGLDPLRRTDPGRHHEPGGDSARFGRHADSRRRLLDRSWVAAAGHCARRRMRSASAWASRVFGILVLVTAGLMAVGADTAISADLTSALPDWTGTLQTLERV